MSALEVTTDAAGPFADAAVAFADLDPAIGDPLGPLVDAVVGVDLVISAVAPVPLPAALPLFATALAGFAYVRHRRRAG